MVFSPIRLDSKQKKVPESEVSKKQGPAIVTVVKSKAKRIPKMEEYRSQMLNGTQIKPNERPVTISKNLL